MKRDATGRRKSTGRGGAATQASAAAGGWAVVQLFAKRWRRRREEEEAKQHQNLAPLPLHPSLAARRRDERDQVSVSAAVNYLTEIHYQTTRS